MANGVVHDAAPMLAWSIHLEARHAQEAQTAIVEAVSKRLCQRAPGWRGSSSLLAMTM